MSLFLLLVYTLDVTLSIMRIRPHPYRVRPDVHGFSHGLNKCPPDTFLPRLWRGRPLRIPAARLKNRTPRWGVLFFVVSVHFRCHFSRLVLSLEKVKNSNISFASFDMTYKTIHVPHVSNIISMKKRPSKGTLSPCWGGNEIFYFFSLSKTGVWATQ